MGTFTLQTKKAMMCTLKFQMDVGVNENTIRKAIRYTLRIQSVRLLTTASSKSLNTTAKNIN